MSQKKYQVIGLGGTFDHFHVGHQHFLQFASELAEEIRVGITIPELTKNKILSEQIQSFEVRRKEIEDFLKSAGINGVAFSLIDQYGPTLTTSEIQAIAVTEFTKSGGEVINQKRQEIGLATLPIYVCDLVKDEDGEYISSTRIRQGVINREGKVYQNLFANDLFLDEMQRQFFSQKQGEIVVKPTQSLSPKFVVGDVVLETFLEKNWTYDFGVYDLKNLRTEYNSEVIKKIQPIEVVTNEAGMITVSLIQALQTYLDARQNILVNGEEDLAAVALTLLAPLGSGIYYGQPNEGIIEMIATEELKGKFYDILHRSSR